MLARLRISQYALVDDVEVGFGPGLNVLTGETGAGKSILIEGLELLRGGRASQAAIREDADRGTIEGVFVIDGEETLVRRDLFRDRSSRCAIDDRLVTARMLRERIGGRVEIQGQHEDVRLLKRAFQRELLDGFADASELAARVAELARKLTALEREHEALARAAGERAEREAYLRSQLEELAAAGLEPDEEEHLAAEASRLGQAAERQRLAGRVHDALEGDERSIAGALGVLQRDLDRLAAIDPSAAAWGERLSSARLELEDLAREAWRYAEGIENEPARLAAVEERRDLLSRLKRKHGRTLVEVIEHGRRMGEELARLEAEAVRGASIESDREGVLAALGEAAGALSGTREAAAERLATAVEGRLRALGMGDGLFRVELVRRRDPEGLAWRDDRWVWTSSGLEEVRFLIAPNAGESPRPLSRIASGGETSRASLAILAALAEADRTPTLVFDEVDAGIGGRVAHQVATELASVAAHHQVIVVTHLAQIAAAADRHLVVEKRHVRGRTVTGAREVTGEERVREVSRLLGGDPERDVSRAHAEALLSAKR